jgi:hypothetical protein
LSEHLGTREIHDFIAGSDAASITRHDSAESSSMRDLPIARFADGGGANALSSFSADGVHPLGFYAGLRDVGINLHGLKHG